MHTVTYGPYKCKDNRMRCVIKNLVDGSITSISYPRMVYEKENGIRLDYFDDVHHKDGNPLNNDISNLEVVRCINHMVEHRKYKENVDVRCVWCDELFSLTRKQQYTLTSNKNLNKKGPFCSRSCSGKYGTFIQYSAT